MNIQTAVPGSVHAWTNNSAAYKLLPPGPWTSEPTKVQWLDSATGAPCLIVRNGVGALCGYVGVYADHPLYHKDYDSVDVNVHGGLTFSAPCQHTEDVSRGVCHIPEPGTSDDVWWFGFDCAHYDDLMPTMPLRDVTYRDMNYVVAEVTSLAAQLARIAHNG